jgi:5-formyltetrahydrofolate cyclo-ligase
MTKEEIRTKALERRKAMLPREHQVKSEMIRQRLFALPQYQTAQTILYYISYDNEVATHDIIKRSLLDGKRVVVPITNTQEKTLSLSYLRRWDDLVTGAYSILEPREEYRMTAELENLDLCIIPGVAFDEAGHRIGHGMGFYDRLLRYPHQVLKIGLAFELQIVPSIPAEEHDVSLDMILTELRTIVTQA